MDSEKWQRCKQIFQAALDLPRPERAAYARAAAGDDEELYREVASLLDSEQRSHEFLSQAAANYLAGPLAADSAAHGRLKPGDLLAGRYRIVRLLGRGGMGEVYEAEDLELRAPIAVKLVLPEIAAKPEILDRFKREVLLARQVTHPNVCRIFDLGYHAAAAGRITFLTMEMLSGETLAARLERSGRMTVAEAYPLVEQLAAGLTAAHREGIVHRDFKSANVFLAPGEAHGVRVKIMDFGLARAVNGSDSARTTLTVAGLMIGTPAYMAPEQIAGGEITPATDIYALGIVMYEMVTGVLPFAGDTPWIVATKRLREAPPSPRTHTPELDPLWEAAILRCLEQNPADRYQTAADVMRALSGERLPAPPKAPVPPRRRRPRSVMRLRWRWRSCWRLWRLLLPASAASVPRLRRRAFGWHRPHCRRSRALRRDLRRRIHRSAEGSDVRPLISALVRAGTGLRCASCHELPGRGARGMCGGNVADSRRPPPPD